MAPNEESKKVLVIGLDGATPDLLMQWIKEGKLPTFANIAKDGVMGRLKSTIPPLTCPAWLSFATGKSPGQLGIYDFFDRKPGTYEIRYGANFQFLKSKYFWDVPCEKGKNVGIFNVPTIFPPRKVKGFIVSGWPIPEGATFTYPRDLGEKLSKYAGKMAHSERTIALATWRWYSTEDTFLKGLYRVADWEAKATKFLMNNYNWDVFVTVFSGIDPLQHFFWKHIDPNHPLHNPKRARRYGGEILRFYQKMDHLLGELLNNVDDDTNVVIMSDHGAGPFYNLFNVNDWLRKRGYLKIREEVKRLPLNRLFVFLPKREKFDLLIKSANTIGLLKIYSLITDRSSIFSALAKRARSLLDVIPANYRSLEEVDVNWSSTKAYSFGVGEAGRIYINLKGREPQGIVKLGKEYEELRNRLIEELKNTVDPKTGKKIAMDVFKKEEVYAGEYLDQAPDIVFFMNKETTRIDCTLGHDGFFTHDLSSRHDNCGHKIHGILLMRGPEIKKGEEISHAEIVDLAPTILYMMSCPIPSDMDGKVLSDAFNTSYLKSNPIIYEKVTTKPGAMKYDWSKAEEERIKEKLKALGYL